MKEFFGFAKTLILRPGDISYDFINGRQISLRVPVAAFFIVNILYFLVPNQSDLNMQIKNRPYSGFAEEMVEKKIKERKTKLIEFSMDYKWRSLWISRVFLVLMVFFFSFALFFVNYRKHLKYIDHLVVSFEFMTLATIYILTIVWLTQIWIIYIIALLLLLYAFERMAYRCRPFNSLTNAAILVVLFLGLHMIYNSCVFFLTMWTL
jgi:hypothetical protein